MNDQHPHAGYVGDDAYSTGSFQSGTFETGSFETGSATTGGFAADPLFGALPGTYDSTYESSSAYQAGYTADSGQYDSSQWAAATATQQWATTDTTGYVEYAEHTGQWDAGAWSEASAYDATGQWNVAAAATATFDSGAYDATAWNYAAAPTETFTVPEQYDYAAADQSATPGAHTDQHPEPHEEPLAEQYGEQYTDQHADPAAPAEQEPAPEHESMADGVHDSLTETAISPVAPVTPRATRRSGGGGGGGSRGRRRTPAKRSALLTVAVPSACVMGVAGIAAASVSGLTGNTPGENKADEKAVTAADPASVKPVVANSELDTQLAALSADARDFGDRASRTQERIDLKARQEAERKKREEEAARKEAMRPKFALPVELHQLSARYGQAGVNWMSLHTGIDFPVQYGTPVMAATDGTVRTQWNSAYGNMAIVTAKDGTETWYCHLSSTKIRSGEVKAGEVIAYSGNSGNSTGPHLHFEVRPGGGAAIDPLPWLRSHGLDPTS
ncbi:M23 family peptidase [Streptomyces sp. WAC05374]|uniref:M23 family metallopeptidase n=1 Tax=Streptomyces sp. WAC05374 TaxID=2487420 RepID=UPI000F876A7F|nr:M23 family metallopeptidase [Streptomyces sp. WAC05374]RST12297.1 M23 family peptidase [Streptomyces sp. WAC05374]TDF37673.1 M23 family peptidase [Streptomyces sp. WAC05374]TDF44953.1 M23 family peptidase [Streptomyces sp. WAC05374]TDF46244.1 M23 family peptidase [Streptomyces sp. WAC05374]